LGLDVTRTDAGFALVGGAMMLAGAAIDNRWLFWPGCGVIAGVMVGTLLSRYVWDRPEANEDGP
jgi:hypothetical protein